MHMQVSLTDTRKKRAYEYANVGVNNIRSYGRDYEYEDVGVNNIFLYGHKTAHNLASAGVNN